jgi:glycosyltransferase involved in cell wall biosynthesis
MGRARVAVTVPNPKEGFYLPAVEAMAAGAVVVCPDCIGNRSYCLDGENSFRPSYDEDAIVAAAERALAGGRPAAQLVRAGREMARAHDLHVERRAFLDILDRVDDLWAEIP